MLEILKDLVAGYVGKHADIAAWESVRSAYFWYSYLAFADLYVLRYVSLDFNGAYEQLAKKNLLDPDILDQMKSVRDAEPLFYELRQAMDREFDIAWLYQQYIASDFVMEDGGFHFRKGKNTRDILGAYYTRQDFAYEIVNKVLEDYIHINNVRTDFKAFLTEAAYIDSSCGAGEFLLAVIRNLNNRFPLTPDDKEKLLCQIYGFDADPLAVLITRIRVMEELKTGRSTRNIKLGNPLLLQTEGTVSEKYSLASLGRYYHPGMGIRAAGQRYDVIVGNPPWEKIRFEEKKFLSHFVPDTQSIEKKSDRDRFVEQKISDENKTFFFSVRKDYDLFKKQIRKSEPFAKSACGELNTYALFTQWAADFLSVRGAAALIVKSALLKAQVYRLFFADLTDRHLLSEVYLFTNKRKIFQIDSREEFSVIYLNHAPCKNTKVAVNLEQTEHFTQAPQWEVSKDILKQINPLTGMLPSVRSHREFSFLMQMSAQHDIFQDTYPECKFGRIVHLTNHSQYVRREADAWHLPIYEGKFVEQYDNHYATYREVKPEKKYAGKSAANRTRTDMEPVECRYFFDKAYWEQLSAGFTEGYSIVWRSLTSATNRRTMIATLLPKMPTCQSIQLLQHPDRHKLLHILAVFNSVVFDYLVRLKMAGLDLTQTLVKQIPVPPESAYKKQILFQGVTAAVDEHIVSRIHALYKADPLVKDFFSTISSYQICGKPKKKLMAEIDLLIGSAYDMNQDELRNIVRQFDKFYTKEEAENYFA